MMSRMEKNAQIGDLIQQRQDARVALAHLKVKGSSIVDAYRAFGSSQDRWRVDDHSGEGAVFLLNPKEIERSHPRNLLGTAELANHIRELGTAEATLASITAQLVSLGITG
jgi:hypothetical protein